MHVFIKIFICISCGIFNTLSAFAAQTGSKQEIFSAIIAKPGFMHNNFTYEICTIIFCSAAMITLLSLIDKHHKSVSETVARKINVVDQAIATIPKIN